MSSRAKEDERLAERLEEFRVRFAAGPVGRWATAEGTFDAVSGESWEFRAGGDGKVESNGNYGVSGAISWRCSKPFRLELRLEFDGTPEDPAEWSPPFTYEFRVIEHDAGSEVALCEVDGAFWFAAPLRYLGPCESS